MKKIAAIILCLILVFSLSGCGGSGGAGTASSAPMASPSAPPPAASAPAPSAPAASASSGNSSSGSLRAYTGTNFSLTNTASIAGGYSKSDTAASEGSALPADRKIIRRASLEINAPDASALYRSIVEYGLGLGGYENSYNVANYEAYSVIKAEFKIPPECFSAFINFIGENGNVVNSTMSSEDITESYYDTQIRLDTKRRSLDQYYTLLMKASTIEEIAYIQRIIDGITEDIESLEGRLKVWSSLISMATVTLNIRQDNDPDPVKIRKEIRWNTLSADDMSYLIKQGFYNVTNTIVSVLQWIAIILIGYSPLWIMLCVIALICVFLYKKRKAKSLTDVSDDERDNKTI